MERTFVVLAAFSAAVAVALGAFGAHVLRGQVAPELLGVFETGARWHRFHALGLVAVAWAATRWPRSAAVLAGWLFVAGTVLFSGSLYVLVLTGQRWLGAVTPVGGAAFIAGWLALAWGVLAAPGGR